MANSVARITLGTLMLAGAAAGAAGAPQARTAASTMSDAVRTPMFLALVAGLLAVAALVLARQHVVASNPVGKHRA